LNGTTWHTYTLSPKTEKIPTKPISQKRYYEKYYTIILPAERINPKERNIIKHHGITQPYTADYNAIKRQPSA